jgi:hypothetical protein
MQKPSPTSEVNMQCSDCGDSLPSDVYEINCESCGKITLVLVQADFGGELTWVCHDCQDSSVLEDLYAKHPVGVPAAVPSY